MLTYSLSLKAPIIHLLKKIASAKIAESLWDATFRPEELCKHEGIFWKKTLINYRENTISASKAFVEEIGLPSIFKTVLEESVFSLYQAYSQMLLWKENYDFTGEFELLGRNKLYAPNYFTVDGEFGHRAWAKQIVLDSNHLITSRFYLACLYWFEDETAMLWSDIKNSYVEPFNDYLWLIRQEGQFYDPLITLRICQLENEDFQEALSGDERYAGNFYVVGLKEAVQRGYEYAAYFFWQNIAEQEKTNIASEDSIFYLISEIICDNQCNKFSNFLYLELSKERRAMFFDWSIKQDRPEGWFHLLLSPNTEAVRSEIIRCVNQLPFKLFSNVMDLMAEKIMKEKLHFDCELFEILWMDLSPEKKDEILEKTPSITQMLVKVKNVTYKFHFNNLDNVQKTLTLKQLERYERYERNIFEDSVRFAALVNEMKNFQLMS